MPMHLEVQRLRKTRNRVAYFKLQASLYTFFSSFRYANKNLNPTQSDRRYPSLSEVAQHSWSNLLVGLESTPPQSKLHHTTLFPIFPHHPCRRQPASGCAIAANRARHPRPNAPRTSRNALGAPREVQSVNTSSHSGQAGRPWRGETAMPKSRAVMSPPDARA